MLPSKGPVSVTARPINSNESGIPLQVQIALGPAHKRALGGAVGTICGLGLFALTVFHVVFRPADALDIGLLSQYFYRYDVSWKGAFVGLFWGFFTGFVAGWFLAFIRNLAIGLRVFMLRDKAELASMKDFLDHI
jgi:hypothetical protein